MVASCAEYNRYSHKDDSSRKCSSNPLSFWHRGTHQSNACKGYIFYTVSFILVSNWAPSSTAFLSNDALQCQLTNTRKSFHHDIIKASHQKSFSVKFGETTRKKEQNQRSAFPWLKMSESGNGDGAGDELFYGINKFINGFKKTLNDTYFGVNSKTNDINKNESEENETFHSNRIFTLPVKSIKVGGLRLFLSFHLMAQQNTPEKGSWSTNQVDKNALIIHYCDCSGAISINFMDDEILIDRLGATPSMQYMMQETVLLQSLLDEMQMMAFEAEVNESDRLLVLDDPGDAIDIARDTLSFG